MPSSLLDRIYHFIRGPHPLHPSVWRGRLSSLSFLRFTESDLARCLEIYRLNESGRFPKGVIEEYEKHLTTQSSYFLVTEKDGAVIASGGLSYVLTKAVATFCFGLVHPDYQG